VETTTATSNAAALNSTGNAQSGTRHLATAGGETRSQLSQRLRPNASGMMLSISRRTFGQNAVGEVRHSDRQESSRGMPSPKRIRSLML